MLSLYNIKTAKEYCKWLDDTIKFSSILILVYVFGLIGGKRTTFANFVQILLMVLLGVTMYH